VLLSLAPGRRTRNAATALELLQARADLLVDLARRATPEAPSANRGEDGGRLGGDLCRNWAMIAPPRRAAAWPGHADLVAHVLHRRRGTESLKRTRVTETFSRDQTEMTVHAGDARDGVLDGG
jgi:hypothetical protein